MMRLMPLATSPPPSTSSMRSDPLESRVVIGPRRYGARYGRFAEKILHRRDELDRLVRTLKERVGTAVERGVSGTERGDRQHRCRSAALDLLAQSQSGSTRDQQVDHEKAGRATFEVLQDEIGVERHDAFIALGAQEVLTELSGIRVALGQHDEDRDIIRMSSRVVRHPGIEEAECVAWSGAALHLVAHEAQLIDLIPAVQAMPTAAATREHDRITLLPCAQGRRGNAEHPDHRTHAVDAHLRGFGRVGHICGLGAVLVHPMDRN